MFEQTLEEMTASIYFGPTDKGILDAYGFEYDIQTGDNDVSYSEAVRLVEKMYRMYVSIPKKFQKRYISIINQIIFAFGPEFETLHRKYPA